MQLLLEHGRRQRSAVVPRLSITQTESDRLVHRVYQ